MKKILMIATGGTIASKITEHGLAPAISSDELLSYVPEIKKYCYVDTIQLLNIDSTNIQPEHWVMMTETIEENYDKYDGFIAVSYTHLTGDPLGAIDAIDAAIADVSAARAGLGAMQNRLEHTINNLGVTTENLTAAESRIRDVDMAKEMMAYTKNNILTQAAQALSLIHI